MRRAPATVRRPAGTAAPEAGQRRRGILPALLVLVVLFAGVGMGGMYVLDVKNTLAQGDGVFYPNLYINDIAIGGMTQQEAYDAVSAQVVSSIGAWSVSLVSNGAEVGRITPSTINMRYDVGDQINQLWNVGRTGSTQERYQQVKALQMEPVKRYTTLAYDLSGIERAADGDQGAGGHPGGGRPAHPRQHEGSAFHLYGRNGRLRAGHLERP